MILVDCLGKDASRTGGAALGGPGHGMLRCVGTYLPPCERSRSSLPRKPIAIIVMGPSGVGKSTTAARLTAILGWLLAEGDQFHSNANIERMSRGMPLSDEDRAPWLTSIRDWISQQAEDGQCVIVTCSALKRSYRDILRAARSDVRFVQLVADQNLVAARMAGRSGHFMPASLLPSQFSVLEPLGADEDGVQVDASGPPDAVAAETISALHLDRLVD